jgi:hypothetical protein
MNLEPWPTSWPLPAAGALLAIWSVIATWLIARYRRPNLKYRKFNPTDGEDPTVRFLIRSFEPDNLTGKLRLRLEASAPLDSVEVVAGPWLVDVTYGDAEHKTVLVTLKGFPAEGVIGLRVSPNPGTCELRAPRPGRDEADDTWIVPRAWGPIETPYRWWRSYLFRMVACVVFGALMYVLGCAILSRLLPGLFKMSPGAVDALLLGALPPAVLIVIGLAVPRRGKDTFPGAIDWELSVRP